MDQIRSREAIRGEGAQAAREGRGMDTCRYDEGTEAREEWENGYCTACARAVVGAASTSRVAA